MSSTKDLLVDYIHASQELIMAIEDNTEIDNTIRLEAITQELENLSELLPQLIVDLRTSGGWRQVKHPISHHCNYCGAMLYQAPHGGLYCDKLAPEHEEVDNAN